MVPMNAKPAKKNSAAPIQKPKTLQQLLYKWSLPALFVVMLCAIAFAVWKR